MDIFLLKNTIQNYDWGCHDSLTEIFGLKNPERLPIAELWMGAHPKSPSTIVEDGREVSLNTMLENEPEHIGFKSISQFGEQLPFLFKVLSAKNPLSIQVHPNKRQAEEGFRYEEEVGVPLDAFNRNYRDNNHKPELVYALTEFKAMNGFRDTDDIVNLFTLANIDLLQNPLHLLQKESERGLERFYTFLMLLPKSQKQKLVDKAFIFSQTTENPAWKEVKSLHEYYPGDIGVLSPLLLNVINLHPGEAMYLSAGTLHAYMKGTALEIMASSDNVLRGGLTSKHVDIQELLKIIDFKTTPASNLLIESCSAGINYDKFNTPVNDFSFSIINAVEETQYYKVDAAEILFCIEGEILISSSYCGAIKLTPGESCFVSAKTSCFKVQGGGRLARATVVD